MLDRLDHGPKIFVNEREARALSLLILSHKCETIFCYRLNRMLFDERTLFTDCYIIQQIFVNIVLFSIVNNIVLYRNQKCMLVCFSEAFIPCHITYCILAIS